MSNNARLFDQFWLYPSPAIKKEGSGSDGAVEAGRPESFKGGIDLFSGFPGWSPVQEGAATVGASGLLVTMPRPAGYHLQVEALAPGMPFPQATVKGSGQTILLIEFYRKYTLLDGNNKPVPNVSGTEKITLLSDPQHLVTKIK